MLVGSSFRSCPLHNSRLSGYVYRVMGCKMFRGRPSNARFLFHSGHPRRTYVELKAAEMPSSVSSEGHREGCLRSCFSGHRFRSVKTVCPSVCAFGSQERQFTLSMSCPRMSLKLLPKEGFPSEVKCSVKRTRWPQGQTSACLALSLLICYSTLEPAHAESSNDEEYKGEDKWSTAKLSHGKRVYTDYSITGIPGDGRCLFRSVAHGACLRSGRPAPSESLQREFADELRRLIADEFIKRREETEWFVEGDFDTYVAQMRKPHVWGGEPELLMASHVLRMPITVYIYDEDAGGLISIAEYGQEYGNEHPIRVIYHGFGHYDSLQIPGKKRHSQSRL